MQGPSTKPRPRQRIDAVSDQRSQRINMLGRCSFSVPEAVTRGALRALRDPNNDLGD
jgi:hypothetical protein